MAPVSFQKLVYTGTPEDKKLLQVEKESIDIDTFEVPPHKLLIKSKAFALNPTDWKHMVWGITKKGNKTGSDVAGTVVKVGPETKGFEVGDDVGAFLHGNFHDEIGAFAGYTLVDDYATINYKKGGLSFSTKAIENPDKEKGGKIIPADHVTTYEGAASISLGILTVGVSFSYGFDFYHKSPESYKGKKYLVWGAATSTGLLAVQVAKELYGLTVIAVASSKHHETLKARGADYTYDYRDSDVVEQIKKDHPDILYALDTVANAELTFQKTYDAVADGAIVDNLLGLGEKDLKKVDSSKKVKFYDTLLYEIANVEFEFFGTIKKSPDELREAFDDFVANVLKLDFVKNKLYHNELYLPPGDFVNAVETGLSLLRNDKIFGQKVVVSANHTEV